MRRRRDLSEEEKRLWAGVAASAAPLKGKRMPKPAPKLGAAPESKRGLLAPVRPSLASPLLPHAAGPGSPSPASLLQVSAIPEAPGIAAPLVPRHPMPSYHPPVSVPTVPPLFHPIERPVKRKIAKGRVAIEDRIDLHDKTQVVAHYVLLGFLRQAQNAGLRHVLVITGRGAAFGSRGVIRRTLPHWFETPEFRGLVAGFEPAERVHGGDGAFYVRVRRR